MKIRKKRWLVVLAIVVGVVFQDRSNLYAVDDFVEAVGKLGADSGNPFAPTNVKLTKRFLEWPEGTSMSENLPPEVWTEIPSQLHPGSRNLPDKFRELGRMNRDFIVKLKFIAKLRRPLFVWGEQEDRYTAAIKALAELVGDDEKGLGQFIEALRKHGGTLHNTEERKWGYVAEDVTIAHRAAKDEVEALRVSIVTLGDFVRTYGTGFVVILVIFFLAKVRDSILEPFAKV